MTYEFIDTVEKFENWCIKRKINKYELAKHLGITRQTLYNWTYGNINRSVRRFQNLESGLVGRETKIKIVLAYAISGIEYWYVSGENNSLNNHKTSIGKKVEK